MKEMGRSQGEVVQGESVDRFNRCDAAMVSWISVKDMALSSV